jgi:hypothetical protein
LQPLIKDCNHLAYLDFDVFAIRSLLSAKGYYSSFLFLRLPPFAGECSGETISLMLCDNIKTIRIFSHKVLLWFSLLY